ncbi:hypothetical protein T11_2981 [Trichinella zimbabwensis]|uniref:Uncharacterized protein n=1 Tax=Trichinella zimbabwensis TaxID=268475 RepID=A0A0V1HTW0_9BILA|nr:hypothetical protein T11_2981 [Trichinella zimbabwensis]
MSYVFSICKFMHPMNVQKGSRIINDFRKNDVLSVFNATLVISLISMFWVFMSNDKLQNDGAVIILSCETLDFLLINMKTVLEIFFYVFRLLVCFRLQHSLELILIRAYHLFSRQLRNGRKQIFSIKDKRGKATSTY